MLDELVSTPTGRADDALYEGMIATAPDTDGLVEVVIPSFDPRLRHGPCPYMPRGEGQPQRGDRCLVAFAEGEAPWVVAYHRAPEPAVEPIRLVGTAGQPPFAAGASSFDAARPVGFYRDRNRVYLEGVATIAAAGTVFTLPVGYRPPLPSDIQRRWEVPAQPGLESYIAIYGDGRVVTSGIGWFFLDGIDFRVLPT